MTKTKLTSTHGFEHVNIQKWQRLVDLLADLFNAASGDIIQYNGDHFNVVATSNNEDNFLQQNTTWAWETKTFCKHIVENREEIYINNAPQNEYWKDAPFVKDANVCSYFGQPILWPNGDVFGSFCVIDKKPSEYSPKLRSILSQLTLVIESDLQHITDMRELALAMAEKDRTQKEMMQEITKRKETESKLYSQEAIVSATLDVLVDAVIRIDNKGRILAMNSHTERMFGYKQQELLGRNVNCLMPVAYKVNHDQYLENYLLTKIKKIIGKGRDVEAMKKNGEIFPIRLSVSELQVDGNIQFIGLIEDITEKVEYEKKLQEYALFDNLTKCANRNLLEQQFEYHIAAAQRNDSKFSIAYIDLNKFKPINDTYGHKCGDFVLIEISKRLRENTRETDLVARVGGDEFVIIYAQPINKSKIDKILQSHITQNINYNDLQLTVGASIGYATYPNDGGSMQQLLEYADKDMYSKK